MEFRALGRTGIDVSGIAFGAGPIPGLMTSQDRQRQRETLASALEAGVNWIDTAATYGAGQSESSLGQTLHDEHVDTFHARRACRLSLDARLAQQLCFPRAVRRIQHDHRTGPPASPAAAAAAAHQRRR